MVKKLLIERDPYESRVAVLEGNRAAEVYLEDRLARDHVGNIYKGRVTRVLPGIQAAFVDIGLEREAFLYVADASSRGRRRAPAEDDADERGREPDQPIQDLVRPGMELLAQVIKAPLGSKGARITTQVSLPGRLLVLLPMSSQIGVSRRIDDAEERERLRDLLEPMVSPGGRSGATAGPGSATPDAGRATQPGGLIVRTVAAGRGADELERDLDYLVALWQALAERSRSATAPSLLHGDLDLPRRALRDLLNETFDEVLVQDTGSNDEIFEFLDELRSPLRDRVHRAPGEPSLFEHFGVYTAISGALKETAWLDSGGYVVIHSTEALVAIDVNTGRFVGRRQLADTVLRTNLEAAAEIVRQIRLRDLSGIIVIDFIDMTDVSHRRQVVELLERELERDRSKSQILDMSSFGLVEITRERGRKNLRSRLTETCPDCSGSGRVAAPRAVCLEIRRALWRDRGDLRGRQVSIAVHPAVADTLTRDLAPLRAEVERELETEIAIRSDAGRRRHDFQIEVR